MRFTPSYRSIVWTAIVTGVFSVMVGSCLVFALDAPWRKLPLEELRFLTLKAELESDAGNERLQQELRDLDVDIRSRYFRQQQFIKRGAYLLTGGVIATLMLVRWSNNVKWQAPDPKRLVTPQGWETRQNQLGKIAAVILVLALTAVVLVYHFSSRQPALSRMIEIPATEQPDTGVDNLQPALAPVLVPTQAEIFANWPRFRGPLGSGFAAFDDIPQTWSSTTGEGILWKSPVDLPGVSSPVVWQKRIFLTGASALKREVYCFDTDSGDLIWTRSVAVRDGTPAETDVEETTGFAAPTPATDGQRVYAIFASGDLVAFDFDGNELWSRAFGPLDNPYGHASSLATYRDRVIVQLDQGNGDDHKSRLLALQGATGKPVWEVQREVPASWATPVVIEFEDPPRIITAANPWVIANAADDGRELWRAECLSGDVGPSPIYVDGVVYLANDGACVAAIKDGGRGDVTKSHVLWKAEYGLPDICSPLVTEELLLLVPSSGGLASYDRQTGSEEPLWEQDLDVMLMASPSLVGNHVYLIGENGRSWVVKPHETGFDQVSENDLAEPCLSCPAFQPGRIYIRGKQHLYCIGNR